MAAAWMLSPLATFAEGSPPTLYLIGDSTVRNGRGDGANGQWGWGDLIDRYFDADKIQVVNRALGGRSSRTFLTEGHWDDIAAELKPGDFVLMQFGHNEDGPLDDTSRARGSLPGTGDETREIDNPITHRHETVRTYGWYLRQYIAGVRARNAKPIVCSPVPRMNWQDGRIVRSTQTYALWAREVAQQEGVPFLDLSEIVAMRYDELGPERVELLFHGDHTHTSVGGADLNAASVIAALQELGANPLAAFFLQNRISANQNAAKGDGQTINTTAIQAAIDAAARVGGTVVFSPGVYLTGSLFLKSGVHFRVDSGVEIRGVSNLSAYPILPTRVAGIEMKWPAALINVYEQSNVEITGAGVIDGDGKIWWDKYRALRAEYDAKGLRWAADYDCQRPRLIQIYKSSGVQVRGLMLKRSGFWTVHICYSTKVTVDGVTIRNNIGGRGPSTDGIDVDSSSGITIQKADIECNDDAVVLKAGRDADGLRVNRPTEDVTVRDITVRSGAAGITFGSETSGGIRHVEASGIHVSGNVPIGILFKSAQTRGGTIEDVAIHDIDVRGVKSVFSVEFNWNPNYSYARIPTGISNVPDYWRALATPVPREKGLPHLRNVRISNLRATESHQAFSVTSYADSPLESVTFTNIDIQSETGGTVRDAANWKFVNSRIQTGDGRGVNVEQSRNVTGLGN
jgi:lysophospholipase L1-like esterase